MDYLADIKKREEAFEILFSRNVSIIEALGHKYPQAEVDNLESYIAHRCINIHAMFQTFFKCYATQIDVLSANSFMRIFADHISSLILIYETGSEAETILRHYLSVADSCKEAVCQHCIDSIKALPIYSTKKGIIDNLIQGNKKGYGKYNWKYLNLQTYDINNYKSCSYSFLRLYTEKLSLRSQHIVLLSQYVHGLAGSVSITNNIIVEAKMKTLAQLLLLSFSHFLWRKYNAYPTEMERDLIMSLV